MTTIGYGDKLVITWQGKMVTGFCMLNAIVLLALPIGVLGSAFVEEHTAFMLEKEAMLSARSAHFDALLERYEGRSVLDGGWELLSLRLSALFTPPRSRAHAVNLAASKSPDSDGGQLTVTQLRPPSGLPEAIDIQDLRAELRAVRAEASAASARLLGELRASQARSAAESSQLRAEIMDLVVALRPAARH